MKRTYCDVCGQEILTDALSAKPYKVDMELTYKGEATEGNAAENKIKLEICAECYREIKDNVQMVINEVRRINRAAREENG